MTHVEQNRPRLIALPEVSEITTLGKTSIYELIAAGELRPIKLGRKTVFAESEVVDWVNGRLASRQGVCIEKTGRAAAEMAARSPERILGNKPHQLACARKGQSHE